MNSTLPAPTRKAVTPFGDAWAQYRDAGWPGILPVSRRTKRVLVPGYTGWAGSDPSDAVLRRWARKYETANIAVRMPVGVTGLDVDAYHGGDVTLKELAGRLGPLPTAARTTSRAPEDPVSGIYLFAIPEDTVLNGVAGQGIDVIQRHHRYAIVPPSRHPETGRMYGWWLGAARQRHIPIALTSSIPALPHNWLEYLMSDHSPGPPGEVTATLAEARDWYRRRAYGSPCAFMAQKTDEARVALAEAAEYGGLHDMLSVTTLRLCRWAAEGHPGLDVALSALAPVFLGAGRRRDLAGEWRRAAGGAACAVAPDDTGDPDPCDELAELEAFRGF
ncbi:MAG: bifunctional DNA primase/polymerase [Streptosporangiaceae bacterium]